MDRRLFFLGIGLVGILVFAGAAVYSGISGPAYRGDRETLYQVSTIDALMQGVFDGVEPVGELRKHGDFGLGTFDALDGEMIMIDGVVYQARSDGNVYTPPGSMATPFAEVTFFDHDMTIVTESAMNLSAFSSVMTNALQSPNLPCAIRVHGTFPEMKVRSVPLQAKPYTSLAAAVQNQSEYTYSNVEGTIVGFYLPVYFWGLNTAGYHLHFISDDRKTGGHVLDFTLPAGTTVEYDVIPGFTLHLPTKGGFTGADLSQDMSAAIARVER